MLFQADELLQPSSQLEINLVLPAGNRRLSETEVVCRGEVVRTVEHVGNGLSPALAARILQYHFQHGPLAEGVSQGTLDFFSYGFAKSSFHWR